MPSLISENTTVSDLSLNLSNTPNFIDAYTGYADVLEVPPMMHRTTAIQLVGSLLNRNGVTIGYGSCKISLDLWMALLSKSGQGRSTLTTLVRPVLEAAKINDLIRTTDWGSPSAFKQQLAEHPSGLYVWGELSEKLKNLKDSQGGLKQWITDRYDNFVVPENVVYRQTGKQGDTPSILFTEAPRTNILATSSLDWFFTYLEQEDTAGGFLPRWMLIKANGPSKIVPIPKPLDKSRIPELAGMLTKISAIRGVVDISEIEAVYGEWYGRAQERFDEQPDPSLAGACFNRHRVHVLKLAAIFEAARSYSLRISEPAWNCAVKVAREIENNLFEFLATGMSSSGRALAKMEDEIRAAGEQGLTRSEFTRKFQHQPSREREERLRTLRDSGMIRCVKRQTSGRPANVLVHRDFACGHEQVA